MKTILCKIFDFECFLLGQNKIIVRLELPLISLKYTPIPVVKCFSKRKKLFFLKIFIFYQFLINYASLSLK